ncbi:Hypothetical protein A7982_02489 [Minicystis rosea]|nr:Hypothetical protein A7982_02489 [Minicystis rosea]
MRFTDMLRSYLAIAGTAVTALGLAASVNCGGSTETTNTGGTGGGTSSSTTTSSTGGGNSGTHAQPPGPGASNPGDGTGSVTLAVSKLYLGNTKPDGTPDSQNGWKNFGFDLDGKISTATSTDLCKPRDNAATKNVYPDGNDGIDNSFGKNILPIILGLASDAPEKINDSIAEGSFTIMLDMQKLGTGADYNPLTTQLYAGANLGAAPKWDGTDKWPVVPELLVDPTDITKGSKVTFPMSYVTGNTWVSGSKGNVVLSLSISGFTLELTIASAQIMVTLDSAHKKGTKGVIAGILETDKLISELKKVAGAFDPSLCSGATIDSITSQIAQASDIMKDGSQAPGTPCDGISIGLGFDADIVQLGTVADPAEPKPDPCNP